MDIKAVMKWHYLAFSLPRSSLPRKCQAHVSTICGFGFITSVPAARVIICLRFRGKYWNHFKPHKPNMEKNFLQFTNKFHLWYVYSPALIICNNATDIVIWKLEDGEEVTRRYLSWTSNLPLILPRCSNLGKSS